MPDKELVLGKPEGFLILTPQNKAWEDCVEACLPEAERKIRYAIKKDTRFDRGYLKELAAKLPEGYELKEFDERICDQCMSDPLMRDFIAVFESRDQFLKLGRGMAVMKNGRIVSGASSYSRYRNGIEVEVITAEEERRKGLAAAACAALILRCLKEGLYPSWDAANMNSVRLAQKLGYEFDHEYPVYEVSGEKRSR